MATNSGVIFAHESGEDDDGLPMDGVFIESADFDLQDGNDFAFVRRMMPDIKILWNKCHFWWPTNKYVTKKPEMLQVSH